MRLRQRLLIAPMVAMVFLLVIGAEAFHSLRTQERAMNEIFTVRLAISQEVTTLRDELLIAHANVYRLLAWIKTTSSEKIEQTSKTEQARIERTIQRFDVLEKLEHLTNDEKQALQQAKPHLLKYQKSVAQAIDMASVDPAMGASAMQTADQAFYALDLSLSELSSQEREMSREAQEGIASSGKHMLYRVGISIVAAIVLGLGLSLFMASRLARQIGGEPDYAARAAQRIAAGDLTQTIEYRGSTNSLLGAMADMQRHLHQLVAELRSNADRLTGAAEDVTQAAGGVANSAQSQFDATSNMASAVEELTVSIGQVAENAQAAQDLSRQAGSLSQRGEKSMSETTQHINGLVSVVRDAAGVIRTLDEQSDQITAIVRVIKDVADQTNLLALNAAIEAARAGEQGRGFAVVADEVRKLAERTTASTAEISGMISRIQGSAQSAVDRMEHVIGDIDQGVTLAGAASTAIGEIHARTDEVNAVISAISNALHEQTATSGNIAQNVERVAQMAEANGQSATSAAQTAQRMRSLANELKAAVQRFKV